MSKLTTAIAFLLVLAASTAWAATVPELSIEELTQASDQIVVGEVVAVDAAVEGDYVVSAISISVSEVWKGEVVDMLTIRQRGGRTAELATVVPGMPNYRVGERAVLFLEARQPGRYVVTGLAQGKMTVTQATDGTDVITPTTTQEAPVLQQTPSQPLRLPADSIARLATRLDDLRQQVGAAQ